MGAPDRLSTTGQVSVVLDFRTETAGSGNPTARYVELVELVALLNIVASVFGAGPITGPGPKVFFDFGRVTITGVHLGRTLERFGGPT